ncbi:hypothetical protein HD597_000221 [Nonomuraea thailandensis]|uniref:DUF3558 domain-containing protein n=1 Tax=Nonomuraea thailandensis TaxID=1188745 RepID=A0A9X2K167_9ACTN|nr:DUF3558 domain-containing protein [Nonomuraea thailandensis]MCP2353201.1 hypothetical protein [Nonomuraea thailandensis]
MMVLIAVATACGLAPAAAPSPATPTTGPSRPKTTPTSAPPAKESVLLKAPTNPCRVLTASIRSRLGVRQGIKDRLDPACKWSNDPGDAPPFKFRDLTITYDAGFKEFTASVKDAKESFATKRRSDYRQPSVFGGAPSVKGTIQQIGTAKTGEHFDEGYYVYFVYEVGEAKRGEGKAVLRKGNVVITIGFSGADVPGRRMRDSKPIGDATAQAALDIVAGQAIAAVR